LFGRCFPRGFGHWAASGYLNLFGRTTGIFFGRVPHNVASGARTFADVATPGCARWGPCSFGDLPGFDFSFSSEGREAESLLVLDNWEERTSET
jgi:hypothetical protein